MIISKETWKVGELAKQTGLTVRMLHHYDKIGLFSPSSYSDTGHRLYNEADISRLQQIMSLKHLGFSLEDIKQLIINPNFNPIDVIKVQLEGIKEQIRLKEQLCNQLEDIYTMLINRQDVKAKEFIKLIKVIDMDLKDYFTLDQLAKLRNWGDQHLNEWTILIEKVRTELQKGTPPEHPELVRLAMRWKELSDMVFDGNPEIAKSAECYFTENPDSPFLYGMDKEFHQYIWKALSRV